MSARDLIGYGRTPPDPRWPGGARIAVQFVINYEEGGGEQHPATATRAPRPSCPRWSARRRHAGARAMAMESLYEYGSRAGFWRLHRLFAERGMPVTVFGVAMAMERNPAAVEAMLGADWEIACHGLRWIDYQYVPEAVEREHIAEAIALHHALTGCATARLVSGPHQPQHAPGSSPRKAASLYDADCYADDLPYWDRSHGRPQLIVPYTLDANDMRFVALQRLRPRASSSSAICATASTSLRRRTGPR